MPGRYAGNVQTSGRRWLGFVVEVVEKRANGYGAAFGLDLRAARGSARLRREPWSVETPAVVLKGVN